MQLRDDGGVVVHDLAHTHARELGGGAASELVNGTVVVGHAGARHRYRLASNQSVKECQHAG